jgi:hypothetical protein
MTSAAVTTPPKACGDAPGVMTVARLGGPLLVAAAAAGALAYVAAVDPHEPGRYPTCPFLWATGLLCPGCGALRTVHALTRLDVATAVSLNVLVTVAAPLLVLWWTRWTYRQVTQRPRRWLAPTWSLWLLVAAVAGFWVLRNVPGLEVLAP